MNNRILRAAVCVILVLCTLISTPIAALAAKPQTAAEAVTAAVDYCAKAQQIVDLVVDIAINGDAAQYFSGSSTSSTIKDIAIDLIKDELVKEENRPLVESFGFDPEEDQDLIANEVYYVACVYYDELKVNGGTAESANKLAVIELIRFVLVEVEGYTNADAQQTAEFYHEIDRIYKAEGEAKALEYAASQLGEDIHSHTYTSVVTAPTCTEKGYTTYTCTCGDTYTANEVAALGHKEVVDEGYAATCTEEGLSDGVHCDRCNEVLTEQEVIPATGHHFADGNCADCDAKSAIIKTQPKTSYAKMGKTVKVTVKAEGDGLTYKWYIKNAGAKKYSKSSVTKATYSTTMSDKSKGRRVYCVITDAYGNSVQTKTVLLREAVSIVTEPKTTYAKSGKTAKVTVEASGDDLTYAWYIKNAGAKKYSKSSVTSATYSVKMSEKVNGRRVYCVVTDKYGKTVQTKTVILRMAATITTQPKDVTVAKGKTAKVTVKAVGDDLTYTWYVKNEGASKFSKSSVTKATYSVKMSSKVDGRQVYCVVTDKYGKTVKSNTVTLHMK